MALIRAANEARASTYGLAARKEMALIRAANEAAFQSPQGGVAEREQVSKNEPNVSDWIRTALLPTVWQRVRKRSKKK